MSARRRALTRRVADLAPLTALLGFLWWFGATNARDRFWLMLGIQALWIAVAVVGLNLLVGHTGLLSLGHWAFFLYGGFVGAIWTTESWGLDPWLGFPLALAAGLAMGALLAATTGHLRGFHLTVMTLAFGLLASSLALLFDSEFNGFGGRGVTEPLDTRFSFLDRSNPNQPFIGLYLIGVVLLLGSLYVTANLVRSRWGRAFHAIRESELAAAASGVPTAWAKVAAFSVSAGLVSVAGVLAAQTNLQVTMAEGTSIVAQSFRLVVYAFIGGLGTLAGPVVGAFLLTLGFGVEIQGQTMSDRLGEWETLFFAAMVLVGTLRTPSGIVGSLRDLIARRRARTPAPPPDARPVDLRPTTSVADGALLDVRNVTQQFGGVVALKNVDLRVRPETIHALIGPNGSGKSTLANVVTGIYRPQTGTAIFRGHDLIGSPSHRCLRSGVARTFQNCQIWRQMTVLDNVRVGTHTRSRTGLLRAALLPPFLRPDERRLEAEAWDLLHLVGLASRADELARALPFVDQRRLEIARALASHPALLILDEPAAGMHPADVAAVIDLIKLIRDAGVTVLLIEHHMEVVMELSDRVTVLDFGRVIAEGTPSEVAAHRDVVAAYLGHERAAAAPQRAPLTPLERRPLLTVRDLTVTYGAAAALTTIDLDVFEHEIVALVGANGAGKSTLLKAISGVPELLMDVRGEITFEGHRIDRLSAPRIARRGLVQVPEGRRVFPESTVEENLLLGAHRRRDCGAFPSDLEAVYERFPVLRERRAHAAGLLSGGEQQMLAIGRALMARPSFLLLDEPSLGLAPNLTESMFDDIRRLADEGIAMLLVEQHAAGALAIADRAYLLETGRIVKQGLASEIAGDAAVKAAYVGR